MRINHQLNHRLVACILLVSLFLQSCGNFSNQIIPRVEKIADDTSGATRLIDVHPLTGQQVTAEKGYLVSFHEKHGALQADVKVDVTQKPIYKNLPVTIEAGTALATLPHFNKEIQQRRIQLERSPNGEPSRVYIFKGGLSGGMKKGDLS